MASNIKQKLILNGIQSNKTAYMKLKVNSLKLKTDHQPKNCNILVTLIQHSQQIIPVDNQGMLPYNSRIQENQLNQNLISSVQPTTVPSKRTQQQLLLEAKADGNFKNQQPLFFQCVKDSHILFEVSYQNQQDNSQKIVGFSKFPISSFYKMPNVLHLIDIDIIDEKKAQNDKIIVQIADMEVEILIISGTIGTLQLFMIQAKLERDTQLIGQMDPYVNIIIDGHEYSTNVSEGAGKNPVWNTKIKFPIESTNSQMLVRVLDKDLTTDDIVGQKNINLFREKFLIPTKKLQNHPIYIFYQQKPVGKLSLQARFTLNESGM